jgi:hypothetical protein
MKLRVAVVAIAATLAGLFVAPLPAHAAPDGIACSVVGSYSRVINGVAYTFWRVGGNGSYQYWHAVQLAGSTQYYNRSYAVICSGGTIAWSTDIFPTTGDPARCNPQSTLTYRYVGSQDSYPFVGAFIPVRYHYWHVMRFVFSLPTGFWTYDHSEVARC